MILLSAYGKAFMNFLVNSNNVLKCVCDKNFTQGGGLTSMTLDSMQCKSECPLIHRYYSCTKIESQFRQKTEQKGLSKKAESERHEQRSAASKHHIKNECWSLTLGVKTNWQRSTQTQFTRTVLMNRQVIVLQQNQQNPSC